MSAFPKLRKHDSGPRHRVGIAHSYCTAGSPRFLHRISHLVGTRPALHCILRIRMASVQGVLEPCPL